MAVFTVTNLNDNGSGSFRQAIEDANVNEGADVIEFAKALSGGTITLKSGKLSITDSLEIKGLGASLITISGNDSYKIFDINDETYSYYGYETSRILDIQISGLTLTDGLALNQGGAIYNADEKLTLIDTVITGNVAEGLSINSLSDYYNYRTYEGSPKGGAIYNASGTVTLINSVISGNKAFGVSSKYGKYLGNAAFGGGIYSRSGNLNIINSIITGNTAIGATSAYTGGSAYGGGIFNRSSNVTIINSTISDNQVLGGSGPNTNLKASGGGIDSRGSLTINNSQISGNKAIGGKGFNGRVGYQWPGLYASDGQSGSDASAGGINATFLTISNSQISGNTAIGGAGGNGASEGSFPFIIDAGSGGNASAGGIKTTFLTISNSIVTGNTAIGGTGGNGGYTTIPTNEPYFVSSKPGKGGNVSGAGIEGLNVTVTNTTITGNTAIGGKGGNSSTYLGYTSNNYSTATDGGDAGNAQGGGINATNITVTNSNISANKAIGGTGGEGINKPLNELFSQGGKGGNATGAGINGTNITVNNSTVSTNAAEAGLGGEPKNLTANNGVATGGGINGSNTTLTNSTVTANTVNEGTGGGVSGNGTVTSTIIAGNTDNLDIAGNFTSGGNNLIGNGGTATGFTNGVNGDIVGTATNPIDPNLSPLQDNGGATLTHIPLPGSPAIDAGSNPKNLVTDQRLAPRVVGGSTDIGAVEVTDSTKIGNDTSNSFAGTTGGDFLDGRSGNDAINGGIGNDAIRGGAGSDRLTGGDGNDVLIGGADRDILLGGKGADIFLFESLTDSLVTSPDRIRDFNQSSGDRFLLLPTNPTALFNAGVVVADNLESAVSIAYNDKNQGQDGQKLGATEAVFFSFGGRRYLSMNDSVAGFNPYVDLVAEISGATLATGDETAGVLNVANYFL